MRRQLQRSVPYLSEEFLSFGMMRPIQRRVVKESVGEKAVMRCLRYRAIAHAGSMNSKKKTEAHAKSGRAMFKVAHCESH